jgi:hypothetical protein
MAEHMPPAASIETLTEPLAERFASLALAHVSREYPNKLDHVLNGPEDALGPRALHPVFFGSFDWHSNVHGFWLLARVLRRFPDLPSAGAIRALFAERLVSNKVDGELAYLARPSSRGFERPYGWAWLLALQAEIEGSADPEVARAASALRPLADAFADRFAAFLPIADYPIRTGSHASTAFALLLAADDAETRRPSLFEALRDMAVDWYGADRDASAWEPGGDDFLSPTLIEAECLRRFLAPDAFASWLAAFLPRLADGEPATLFAPAGVTDRTDGKIAHLDGLNLSRAWCWRGIAETLGPAHPAAPRLQAAVAAHIGAGLPHVAGDYMGEHWLATFALLAIDGLSSGFVPVRTG